MKLSNLYTESSISESNWMKKLTDPMKNAFLNWRRDPNVRNKRVEKALKEVYPDVWASYSDNPKAKARLEAYMGSFSKHFPELSKIQDYTKLKTVIKDLLVKRATRQSSKNTKRERHARDPRAKYQGLGLDPDQIDRLVQRDSSGRT